LPNANFGRSPPVGNFSSSGSGQNERNARFRLGQAIATPVRGYPIAKDVQPMRSAGQKRSVPVRALPAAAPANTLNAIAVADSIVGELLPSADTLTGTGSQDSETHGARRQALEIAIFQRIESRLPGRVRNLIVRVFDGVVILEGQCATFYTKQLAQHTAMAVLEDEHLENAIVVGVQQ